MSETRHITTISFDGDATLWDFEKVMRRALLISLDELRRSVPGRATGELTVDRMMEIRDVVAAELQGKTINMEEIRFEAFRRTLRSVGVADDGLAADLNELYRNYRLSHIELYPDAIPALDVLGPQFSLGLLTNGNSHPDRCGLEGRFSFVIFSQEVGVAKPDPGIFAAACRQAGCTPGELMHVGDSLESDVAGANGVGAVSVWLNRNGAANDTGIEPDYKITSLAELPEIVKLCGKTSGGPG